MNMDRLKPCPFCGGKAKYKMTYATGSKSCPYRTYAVICTKCGTERPGMAQYEDATSKWNRRNFDEIRECIESIYNCGNFEEKVVASKFMDMIDRLEERDGKGSEMPVDTGGSEGSVLVPVND